MIPWYNKHEESVLDIRSRGRPFKTVALIYWLINPSIFAKSYDGFIFVVLLLILTINVVTYTT